MANPRNKTPANFSCYTVICSGLHFWRHRFNKFSLNLVNSSWLWWIMRVALTSQKQWNIFWINNIKYYNISCFVRWSSVFVHLYLFQFLYFDWTSYEKEPLQICVSILLIFQFWPRRVILKLFRFLENYFVSSKKKFGFSFLEVFVFVGGLRFRKGSSFS